jgi:23S rRNA pseudouridine1911/1915/1917 synthase
MGMDNFSGRIRAVTTPLPGSRPYTNERLFSVKGQFDGWTLIDFLTSFLPHLSKDHWLYAIENKLLLIDGATPWPGQVVKAGQRLVHIIPNTVDPDVNPNILLIYDDNCMVVLNKPAPIPMHACGRFHRNTLLNILNTAFPEEVFKIVHRLDADTTGIVVFAKDAKTATSLGRQFKERTTQKTYLAITTGIIEDDELVCTVGIGTKKTAGGGREVDDAGRASETIVKVLKRDYELNQTLLQVEPKSGRTNQIRIHLASLGHPIIGDDHYSQKVKIDRPLTLEEDALCLHAWKLRLSHPATGESIEFTAEPPNKFNNFFDIF